jgi:regulatory protein
MGEPRRPRKLDRDQLWDYALRSLGQRAQSASELRQKLARRAESPGDIGPTMDRLREYGFANDETFSEAFAATRLNNQGFGSQRVLRDLAAKRVAKTVAADAVARAYADTSETELIERFLTRKYRGKDLREFFADQKRLMQAFRRLRMAGFTAAGSMNALRKHARGTVDEWPEPDEDLGDAG